MVCTYTCTYIQMYMNRWQSKLWLLNVNGLLVQHTAKPIGGVLGGHVFVFRCMYVLISIQAITVALDFIEKKAVGICRHSQLIRFNQAGACNGDYLKKKESWKCGVLCWVEGLKRNRMQAYSFLIFFLNLTTYKMQSIKNI